MTTPVQRVALGLAAVLDELEQTSDLGTRVWALEIAHILVLRRLEAAHREQLLAALRAGGGVTDGLAA